MSLSVDVRHRLGAFTLGARFESGGRLTALFGPSGAGKTSLVNMIAGLLRPDAGRIVIDDRVLVDTAHGVVVPMHRRRAGCVFQEGRLFPHLTVRQNLRYGLWFTPASHRGESFDHVVDLLGIRHLLDRRPDTLSGGEKQRVAIGRALVASPQILLMDEPLASLDEARKAEILPYIERLRDETHVPIVYVSHSIAEVSRLATTMVVMVDGRVVSTGPPAAVLADPAVVPALGGEAGVSLSAHVSGHEPHDGVTRLETGSGQLIVPSLDVPVGTRLTVRLLAKDVIVARQAPERTSALNVLPAVVTAIDAADGPTVDVHLRCGAEPVVARITRRSFRALEIETGQRVFAILKSVAVGHNLLPG